MANDKDGLSVAFLAELKDVYSAEKQVTKALRTFAKAATAPELRELLKAHRDDTQEHTGRLAQVFKMIGKKAKGKRSDAIAGILERGESFLDKDLDSSTIDAWLIATVQRVKHCEMAAYGTLIAWASVLGHDNVTTLLQQTLDEEKATNNRLTELADDGLNEDAAVSANAPIEEDSAERKTSVSKLPRRAATGTRRTKSQPR